MEAWATLACKAIEINIPTLCILSFHEVYTDVVDSLQLTLTADVCMTLYCCE